MERTREFNTPLLKLEFIENDEPELVFVPHCHDRYEVYCFLSGQVEFRVEGVFCAMEPGTVLLVDRSRFHSARISGTAEQPYRRMILHIDPALFYPGEEILLSLFRRPEILYPAAWQNGLEARAAALERAAHAPEAVRDIAIRTETVGFLIELFARSDAAVAPQEEQPRLREVIQYINAHLTEPLTLEGLAERFYMSRNSLARSFKKAMGTTVPDYILYKRMALARVLLQSGHPVGVTARECGYGDYSTFYRCYRKVYGRNPSEPLQTDAPADTALAPSPEDL